MAQDGVTVMAMSLFPLGRTVATPGALEALSAMGRQPEELFARHACGDDGDLGEEDRDANRQALARGGRIFSCYVFDEARLYLVTEHDRSATTLCLAEEY